MPVVQFLSPRPPLSWLRPGNLDSLLSWLVAANKPDKEIDHLCIRPHPRTVRDAKTIWLLTDRGYKTSYQRTSALRKNPKSSWAVNSSENHLSESAAPRVDYSRGVVDGCESITVKCGDLPVAQSMEQLRESITFKVQRFTLCVLYDAGEELIQGEKMDLRHFMSCEIFPLCGRLLGSSRFAPHQHIATEIRCEVRAKNPHGSTGVQGT